MPEASCSWAVHLYEPYIPLIQAELRFCHLEQQQQILTNGTIA